LDPILFTLAVGQAIVFCRLPYPHNWQAKKEKGVEYT